MRLVFIISLIITILSACTNNQASTSKDKSEPDNIVHKNGNAVEDTNVYSSYIEDYQNDIYDTVNVDDYYSDPLVISYSQHSDTMVINENCVIFLWPDSLEIVEIQNKYPIRYLEILDEMISPASDAAIELDAAGIKSFFCDKSVIGFVNTPKNTFLHRKKAEGDMVMFKYGEKPHVLYAIEFDIKQAKVFFTDVVDTISNSL